MKRKRFITQSLLAGSGLGLMLSGCDKSNEKATGVNINFNKRIRWKMVTTWPPNFPVVGEVAQAFSEWVFNMSGGRLEIKVYGGGELIPPLEVFEAVSSGSAEMGSGASYYWAGRNPVMPIFTTMPFGLNAQQFNAWLYGGGGQSLWESIYDRYNLVPRAAGNTGVQMAGWFNREINSMEDFKGLKMRIPGLGGKVIAMAGGTPVLSPGSELYTNLERGVIDATEWIGPYHDYLMGFHKIAKYYYAPGWHETGSNLEFMINKKAYMDLSEDLRAIVDTACYRANVWVLSEFEAKNNQYLQKIAQESDVQFKVFSPEVIEGLRQHADEMTEAWSQENEDCTRVYQALKEFKKGVQRWSENSEKLFYQQLM